MNMLRLLVSLFQRRKAKPQAEPNIGIPVETESKESLRPHVERAIATMGLIDPQYTEWVLELFHRHQFSRSEGVALAARKALDQMTPAEKAAIGVRSNAFMSRAYYAHLSDKGKTDPLNALEFTLRLAFFLRCRARDIENMKRAGCEFATADGIFAETCGGCRRINNTRYRLSEIPNLPIEGCEEQVCAVSFRGEVTF
ncbi:hypothetical protein [Xanthobacter variabilis]|uniref:hypothetical protein n=1 Tax=Xanthobacter variabilis TaxID=3119932 RepID=UPI00374E217D